MLDHAELERLEAACDQLPPAVGDYFIDDYITNLLATVVDFQTATSAVDRALTHFRRQRWNDVRNLDELKSLFARWPPTKEGNTALAVHLWGYRMWTRANMLRGLVAYLESVGVTDQGSLRRWATTSTYADFKGKVPGLGPAVYQWLVMRQGVDTVKPDVHVHRFVARAIGRKASDTEIIQAVPIVAARLGRRAYAVDWSIWEHERAERPPIATAPPTPSAPAPPIPKDDSITVFVDDDGGYLAWLAAHPGGFVLNCARSPKANYLIVHRAGCSSISGTPSRGRVWTRDLLKVTSSYRASLANWAQLRTGGTPSPCGRCRP